MNAKIVVVGSSNTDMIIKLDRIPLPGETRLGGEFMTAAGGKGANQAVAAARAGGDVTLVARVGEDMFGERAIAGLVECGINVDHVRQDKKPSGVALIFVGEDGENSIAVGSGANAMLSPTDVRQAQASIDAADIVMLQLESPLLTVQAAAEAAAAKGVRVILNPAPAQLLPDALLKLVSVLTPNETEAELLTGVKVIDDASCAKAAGLLLNKGVQVVVLTLGSKGAYVATPEWGRHVPGFTATAIDTTAAGDCFNGALGVALAEGMEVLAAVRFANAAGSIAVTRMGAQPSAPTRQEIEKLLTDNPLSGDAATAAALDGEHLNARSQRPQTAGT